MYNNYDYPPGADTPDAPWNQPGEPEEREFKCEVEITLTKKDFIVSTQYNHYVDQDEDGCYEEIDTSNIEWKKTWEEQVLSPLKLFEILKKMAEEKMEATEDRLEKTRLHDIIVACEDWEVYDLSVEGLE